VRVDTADMEPASVEEPEEAEEEEAAERAEDGGERGGRRRRRRGRGRGERGEEVEARFTPPRTEEPTEVADRPELTGDGEDEGEAEPAYAAANGVRHENGDGDPRRRRRRGRRGGRRNRRPGEEAVERIEANGDASAAHVSDETLGAEPAEVSAPELATEPLVATMLHGPAVGDEEPGGAAKPRRARRTRKTADAEAVVQDAPVAEEGAAERAPRGRGRGRKREAPAEVEGAVVAAAEPLAEPAPATAELVPAPAEVQPEPQRRPRKELPPDEIVVSSTTSTEEAPKKKAGWWQRGFFG
jgi:ribonuclease E